MPEFNTEEAIKATYKTLGSLSYMELKRLHDDEQYSEDFRMTTPDYVSMCRKKDIIEDKTFEQAKKNIK